MPSSGRASPSLHWEWTKKQRKHKLKPMLGLTHQWSRKVIPLRASTGSLLFARLPFVCSIASYGSKTENESNANKFFGQWKRFSISMFGQRKHGAEIAGIRF
jgi:hypothetical protein